MGIANLAGQGYFKTFPIANTFCRVDI